MFYQIYSIAPLKKLPTTRILEGEGRKEKRNQSREIVQENKIIKKHNRSQVFKIICLQLLTYSM
jgi:hypothetical protein